MKGHFLTMILTGAAALLFTSADTESAFAQNWLVRAEMPTPRIDLAVAPGVDAGGKARLYTFGGTWGTSPSSVVEAYSPDGWLSSASGDLPPMKTARTDAEAVNVGGKIVLIGGSLGATATDLVEIYDPAIPQWSAAPPLPQPRREHAAAAIGNTIYVFGGTTSGSPTADVFKADMGATWTAVPSLSLPVPLNKHVAVTKGGKIYVIGGTAPGGLSDKVWIFDPQSGFSPGPTLPEPLSHHVAVVGSNGVLYVMGTSNYYNGATAAYRLVESATPSWASLSPMPEEGRVGSGAGRLGDFVYVLGGTWKFATSAAVNQAFCTASPRSCWRHTMVTMPADLKDHALDAGQIRGVRVPIDGDSGLIAGPGNERAIVDTVGPGTAGIATLYGRVVHTGNGVAVLISGRRAPREVEGEGIAGATVAIESLATRERGRSRTDREGRFELSAAPGEYRITALVERRRYTGRVTIPREAPMGAVVITENGVSQ